MITQDMETYMTNTKSNQTQRILSIYSRLQEGYIINKSEEAINFGVNERTIQRDIDDIRNFLSEDSDRVGFINSVVYDYEKKGFKLEYLYKTQLKNSEVLAICKILLDSRAFTKHEMTDMINRVISCCVPFSNRKEIEELIKNEAYHYVEPRHQSIFIDKMWDIGLAIREHRLIEISYKRTKDKKVVKRRVKPVAIMFSEYYFYLTAFIDDDNITEHFDVTNDPFPTIYRIDRIKLLRVLDEKFHVPYSSRFEEGEFRKRVQFMYGGKLQKVKFKYKGLDIDAILDRLPTAQILDKTNGEYIVSAEVFGKGIDMWLKSQGSNVEILEGGF